MRHLLTGAWRKESHSGQQPSPRSGRQRKAWGGAQRNPRNRSLNDHSPRSGRQHPHHGTLCRPAPRAGIDFGSPTWGSAALHPRLYAVARSAGLAALLLLIASAPLWSQTKSRQTPSMPALRVFLLDAKQLGQTRSRILSGDYGVTAAITKLEREARQALTTGPFS